MHSNNISAFSPGNNGKSVFHRSINSGNLVNSENLSKSRNFSDGEHINVNKLYDLIEGLERRVTCSVAHSENRTVNLIKNALFAAANSFTNDYHYHDDECNDISEQDECDNNHIHYDNGSECNSVSNNSVSNNSVSSNSAASNSASSNSASSNTASINTHLTIMQQINDRIEAVHINISEKMEAMQNQINNKIDSAQSSILSSENNLGKTLKHNILDIKHKIGGISNQINNSTNVLNYKLDDIGVKINTTNDNVLSIQNIVKNLVSSTVSQLSDVFSRIISTAEANILREQTNVKNAITTSEANILREQTNVKNAITTSENIILNGQKQIEELIKSIKVDCSFNDIVNIEELIKSIKVDCSCNSIGNIEELIKSIKVDCSCNSLGNIEELIKSIKVDCSCNYFGNSHGFDLSGGKIIGSDISGAIIRDSTIINSTLINCDLSGNDISGSTGVNSVESNLIHKMVISDTVTTIISYFSNFALGNFEHVRESLTTDMFESLSTQLYLLKSNLSDSSDYEIIRNIIIKSFEALMQMIYQQIGCDELQIRLDAASEKAGILLDIKKLEDYIKHMAETTKLSILPDVVFTAPLVKIKPEIQEYIRLYGLPPDDIFDVDKLGEIMTRLNIVAGNPGL